MSKTKTKPQTKQPTPTNWQQLSFDLDAPTWKQLEKQYKQKRKQPDSFRLSRRQ